MGDTQHILLPFRRSVDIELHISLLKSENIITTTHDLSQNAFDLVSGRSQGLALGLLILAKSTPVYLVDVNQASVVDVELEMVGHKRACVASSGAGNNYWSRGEATRATAISSLSPASAVTATALLLVVS